MKVYKMSDKIVSYCVKQRLEFNKDSASFNEIKALFPSETDKTIADAIKLAASSGKGKCYYASNKPQIFWVDINSVKEHEENTCIRKIYKAVKEIKSLIR